MVDPSCIAMPSAMQLECLAQGTKTLQACMQYQERLPVAANVFDACILLIKTSSVPCWAPVGNAAANCKIGH